MQMTHAGDVMGANIVGKGKINVTRKSDYADDSCRRGNGFESCKGKKNKCADNSCQKGHGFKSCRG